MDKIVISNLVQSAVQYFDNHNEKLAIIHIIVNKYFIDDKIYKQLPYNIKFKKIILEIELICLDRNLVQKVKNLFRECKIKVNKIISFEYAKKFLNDEEDSTMCISAKKVINGANLSEVQIREDNQKKLTFSIEYLIFLTN